MPSVDVVKSHFPKEVPFQKRPGDEAQPLSRQHPARVGEQPKPHGPPRTPKGTVTADENGTCGPKVGLLLGRKSLPSVLSLSKEVLWGSLRREPR